MMNKGCVYLFQCRQNPELAICAVLSIHTLFTGKKTLCKLYCRTDLLRKLVIVEYFGN